MSDRWIKEEVVAPRYSQCVNDGEIDSDRLTRLALLDLGAHEAEYQEFVGQAERYKMRRIVNEYHTAARRVRSNATEAVDNGELPLPGFEDVVKDRVSFVRDGEHVRKETMECDVDELADVIQAYADKARALDQAVIFYVALRQHVMASGADRVKDLYAA